MSEVATYFLENAKSSRATCTKCKVKIALKEVRIGVSAPNRQGYVVTRYVQYVCEYVYKQRMMVIGRLYCIRMSKAMRCEWRMLRF